MDLVIMFLLIIQDYKSASCPIKAIVYLVNRVRLLLKKPIIVLDLVIPLIIRIDDECDGTEMKLIFMVSYGHEAQEEHSLGPFTLGPITCFSSPLYQQR